MKVIVSPWLLVEESSKLAGKLEKRKVRLTCSRWSLGGKAEQERVRMVSVASPIDSRGGREVPTLVEKDPCLVLVR